MDVLTLVQNNESYSRENTPVLVPIRGDATQTPGDMFKEKKRKHQSKMQRPKRILLPSVHVPTSPQVPLGTNR